MTTEHTPIPWQREYGRVFSAQAQRTIADCEMVDAKEDAANAALIVRAVNSFDAMKAALQRLVNLISDDESRYELYREEMEQAAAALALAERGEK